MIPPQKFKSWSPKEDAFLKKHFGKLSYEEIARKLGRTYEAVKGRSFLIGCRTNCMADNPRDNAYMEKARREIYGS